MESSNIPPIRILLVDDFEPFRHFVSSILDGEPQLQVVGEVSDGLDAVEKTAELRPDLILLDIGLPTVNGIEAARRIRELAPRSRIVFLTQESDPDVVREALDLGAAGYVLKTQVGSDLLVAIDAAVRDELFVSGRLAGRVLAVPADSESLRGKGARGTLQDTEISHCHEVQFYSNESVYVESLTRFIATALATGKVTIVVATKSHREALLEQLQAQGIDIISAIERGSLIPFDSADVLAEYMIDDRFDPARMRQATRSMLECVANGTNGERRPIAACGEIAPILWAQGKMDAAIEIEQFWNELCPVYGVDLLCSYPRDGFPAEDFSQSHQRVCAEHSAVYSR
jgi:DNA-binding NarL/FixJ family response regulator